MPNTFHPQGRIARGRWRRDRGVGDRGSCCSKESRLTKPSRAGFHDVIVVELNPNELPAEVQRHVAHRHTSAKRIKHDVTGPRSSADANLGYQFRHHREMTASVLSRWNPPEDR